MDGGENMWKNSDVVSFILRRLIRVYVKLQLTISLFDERQQKAEVRFYSSSLYSD